MEVKINLIEATKDDILQLDFIYPSGKKKFKLRHGVPYWLLNSKGQLENKNYVISEHTDAKELGVYLSNKQIFIPK